MVVIRHCGRNGITGEQERIMIRLFLCVSLPLTQHGLSYILAQYNTSVPGA